MQTCAFTGDLTLNSAGTYLADNCFSGVAGTATPSIDFGAALANTNLNFRHYSGGIEVKNMGQNGVDTMSLEGDGQIVLNANCAGGTIAIRGNFTVTDNAGGAVTLSDNARYDVDQVQAADVLQINSNTLAASNLAISAQQMLVGTVDDTAFAPTTSELEASDITEATADHFNGRVIIFTSGNLLRQLCEITDYSLVGGRGHFTVASQTGSGVLTEAPATTDTFIIV